MHERLFLTVHNRGTLNLSFSQPALPREFETTSTPDDYDDMNIDNIWTPFVDESLRELPKVTDTPAGDKKRPSSISVVGPQTPINWRPAPEISPPPRTLPPPAPQPNDFMKGTLQMKSSFPKRYKSIWIVFMKMTFFYLDPYILLIFNLSC